MNEHRWAISYFIHKRARTLKHSSFHANIVNRFPELTDTPPYASLLFFGVRRTVCRWQRPPKTRTEKKNCGKQNRRNRKNRKIIMMKAVVRSKAREHHGAVSYGPFAKAVNTDCGIMCDLVARRTSQQNRSTRYRIKG